MAVNQIQLSAAGTSLPVVLRRDLFHFGIGLLVTVDATVTACNYTVQVCGDKEGSPATHWNNHDILQNLTASANSNLAFPVVSLRLVVASYTGTGNITLNIVTVEPG